MRVVEDLQPPAIARGLLLAQHWLQSCLWDEHVGRPGREYLAARDRSVSHMLAHTAGLGYAPAHYANHLAEQIPRDVLTAIGLLDERGREVMAGRVTFPWLSIGGRRVIGIGGRKIEPESPRPKYANSPETPWYAKGNTVLGLHQASAAIHGADWALVVEGPFDMLALWDMGWTNAVATVGAKVTREQLSLVARLTDRIVVLLDDDEGGRRGEEALRKNVLRDDLLPAAVDVRTARLVGANDPAEATPEQIVSALEVSAGMSRSAVA